MNNAVIKPLYEAFGKYPFNSNMDACPCCVNDAEKQKLKHTALSDLQFDDLDMYTFKAKSTWGEVDDFKYFIPRILEVNLADDNGDFYLLMSKLDYMNWREWPENEQEAIANYFKAVI